jgi:putative Mn2+ efflux pump MntP
MGIISIILIAIGLAMDAFAASICCGLSDSKNHLRLAFVTGFLFGFFQGMMPIIGWFLGLSFKSIIQPIDHYVAFVLLGFIGGNMILESFKKDVDSCNRSISFKTLLSLAFATSIDALATGISFVALDTSIILASSIIATITFIISFIGVCLGKRIGRINHLKQKIDILGGTILIGIGTKILITHLILGC